MKLQFILLTTLLALTSTSSQAARFTFTQEGFDDGAVVSGYFEANDLNGDGQILAGQMPGYDMSEITDFSLSFSGNALVSAFTQGLSDLTVFSYKLGTGFLGDDSTPYFEAIGSNWFGNSGFAYSGGIGSGYGWSQVESIGVDGALSISNQQMAVTAVPVPGAFWLFGSMLLGWIGHKKRA